MSKSILVIDTPKSCSECDFKFGNLDYRKKCYCLRTGEEVQNYMKQERHPQCPLQDTTELLEAVCRLGSRANRLFKIRPKDNQFDKEEQNDVLIDKLYKALGLNNDII